MVFAYKIAQLKVNVLSDIKCWISDVFCTEAAL
jgi:hypothetical protein